MIYGISPLNGVDLCVTKRVSVYYGISPLNDVDLCVTKKVSSQRGCL